MRASGDKSSSSAVVVTVRGALALEPVRRGVPEVLAGEDHLDRGVRWAHSGEVPNMASLLKGGELLLTTGMGLQRSEEEQRRFITELADRSVAAVAIELGTTFTTIPEALVDEARKRGLPLIALHREVPFVEITEALHHEIVNRQFMVMRRGDELHRSFTELVLAGAGIPEVLHALSHAIANPVVLDKDGQGVLYHSTHHAPSGSVLAAWDAVKQDLTGAPEAFTMPVPTTGQETWGRIAAIALDSPLDDFDRVAVERAVELIALALLRHRQEEALAGRERGNFLAELLEQEVDEAGAVRRATDLGIDRRTPFLLPFAVKHAARKVAVADRDDGAWALLWRDVRRELATMGIAAVVGTRAAERDMLLVVGLDDPARRKQMGDRVARVLTTAAERHLHAKQPLVICVGGEARSWLAAAEQMREAIDALPAAATGRPRGWHDAARADLHRMLWSIRNSEALEAFVDQRLAPLIEHDATRKSKLLPTLFVYCELWGRKAETARSLHLERQSLYHRLERIEALLGEDLSDDDTLLELHIALRAYPYIRGGTGVLEWQPMP
jgi:purine catabolism regulator